MVGLPEGAQAFNAVKAAIFGTQPGKLLAAAEACGHVDFCRVSSELSAVSAYRFYFISSQNQIVGTPVKQRCDDDAAALLRAGELAAEGPTQAMGVEVWKLSRLVGRVPLDKPAAAALPQDTHATLVFRVPYTQADLDDACCHVRDGEIRLAEQRQRILKLAQKGLPTDTALLTLGRLHEALQEMRRHRDEVYGSVSSKDFRIDISRPVRSNDVPVSGRHEVPLVR